MENTETKVTIGFKLIKFEKQDMEFLRQLLIEEFASKNGSGSRGYIRNSYITTLIDKLGNGLGLENNYWKNNILPKCYDKWEKKPY